MAYITQADIEARMGSEGFLRAADRDGDGVADAGLVAAVIGDVETTVDAMLAASHGTPFADPVPSFVKNICIMLAPHVLVSFFAGNNSSTTSSPYKGLFDRGMELLKSLAKDDRARLPSGPPSPTNLLAATPDPTPAPWGDARAGKKHTAF